jgi:hypothetical protein
MIEAGALATAVDPRAAIPHAMIRAPTVTGRGKLQASAIHMIRKGRRVDAGPNNLVTPAKAGAYG